MNANTFIPEHFIDDVKTYLPAHLNLDDFINACRRPLRKSIRVNTLKISVAEFKHRAEKKNWQLTPIPWCSEGFWLERPSDEEQNLALGVYLNAFFPQVIPRRRPVWNPKTLDAHMPSGPGMLPYPGPCSLPPWSTASVRARPRVLTTSAHES